MLIARMEPSGNEAQAAAVLARIAEGDALSERDREAALAVIGAAIERHQRAVYALCRTVVGEPEQAAELAQQALLVALQRVHTYSGDASFRSWLLGIARFTSLRAVSRKREHLLDDGLFEVSDPVGDALAVLRRQARADLIREAAATLEPLEQEAIHLRYVEGLGQDEITRILGLTDHSGAQGLLLRCRRKLARAIEGRLAELGHGMSFFRAEG